MRLVCLLATFGMGLLACDGMDLEGEAGGPVGGKADGSGEPGADSGELPALDRDYSLVMTSVLHVRNNETGEVRPVETRSGSLLSVEQDGEALRFVAEPCFVSLPEIAGRQPELGEGVVENMPPVVFEGALVAEEGGVQLLTEPSALQLGVALGDPLADELPDGEDDPRVVDLDGDGRPGVSVRVSGFRIYVGARVIFALSAPVDEVGEISGASELTLDSVIYGDDIPFFSARNAAAEAGENSDVVGEENTFAMRSLADRALLPTCVDVY